jgi:hypothetical protein
MEKYGLKYAEKQDLLNETILKPDGFDKPAIRIREIKERAFCTAEFELELSGVAYDGAFDPIYNRDIQSAAIERYRNSMLSGLLDTCKVRFIYDIGFSDTGQIELKWRVKGIASGETYDDSVKKAEMLWGNLNTVLRATERKYIFNPVQDPILLDTGLSNIAWTGTIKPITIKIANEQKCSVGFHHDVSVSESFAAYLPIQHIDNSIKNFDSVIQGATGPSASIRVDISISQFALTKNEKTIIGAALRSLQRGKANFSFSDNNRYIDFQNDDNLKDRVQLALDTWANNPYGFRVSCNVISSEIIPMSYLNLIGSELFRGAPISIELTDCSTIKSVLNKPDQSTAILDFGNCINTSYGLPPLFPHPQTLLDAGIKKSYTHILDSSLTSGIVLGKAHNGIQYNNVYFSQSDRSKGTYLIGASGTGKSELLNTMIQQDIASGRGVALLDPHGDLYNKVLDSIPRNRLDDVVLVDFTDFENAVGINFLEINGRYKAAQINFVANEMIMIFDRLYNLREVGGPIFESYFRQSIYLLLESDYEEATLMDIPRLFEDADFREFLKKKCKNPITQDFWTCQAEAAGGEMNLKNITPYISSKLNQFVASAILRPVIGQPKSTIDVTKIINDKKIILVNLSKGLLGQFDTQLLGMLVIGKIFNSAMGRISMKPETRNPFYLYVDEFQNFTTDSVAYLLSEARKFGICLTLANQNLSQLHANQGRHNILDAVLGNVGSCLMFRVGPEDSAKMESFVKPYLYASDLQELPDYHVACRLLTKNVPARPFVFKTVPAIKCADSISPQLLTTLSQSKYTKSILKIERAISHRRKSYKTDD